MASNDSAPKPELSEEMRAYWMSERNTLIMKLGALEDMLGLERSIIPRRKRKEQEEQDE